jgi:hypothetical protein
MTTTPGTFPGIRIQDMPDLGAVTDTTSFVSEKAGSGLISALALRDYVGTPGNSGVPEAPTDGRYYGRASATWQPVAPISSPAFTGTPTAPTASPGANSSQIATTAFVKNQGYISSGDIPPPSSTVPGVDSGTGTIGTQTTYARGDHAHPIDTSRAPLANPVFTGDPQAPTPATADNDTSIATTAFVKNQSYAPLANPVFTGDPQAPTPLNADNDTSVATTAYVKSQRLDQFQVPTSAVSFNGQFIRNVLDPQNNQDVATKSYVDAHSAGLVAKGAAAVATVGADITLSGLQVIDGYTTLVNDRVLVKNQTLSQNNGIYVAASGAWTRATDMDTWAEVPQAYVFVSNGAVNSASSWVCNSTTGGTLGTTPILWVQFSQQAQVTAGGGLTRTGNQFDAVGTAGRIAVFADNIDIDASYLGQSSIITLGSVTTGTWNANTITVARGGTGTTTLTGYVKGAGGSPFVATATIPYTDISGLSSNYLALAGGNMLGAVALAGVSTAPTAPPGTNTTQIASTGFVTTALLPFAPLASPALTGTPTAPTAAAGTSTTQLATTAFVGSAVGGLQPAVPSVAALRALATGAMSVFVQGYSAVGDGGGGNYIKGAAGTDNGGSIIVSANGTYYLQTYGQPVSVRQFGAKGDGSTNDGPACQNALNASLDVVFPAGPNGAPATYWIQTTLWPQAGAKIRGSGTGASTILQMANNTPAIWCSAASISLGNIIISDLTIRGGVSSVQGIYVLLYSNVTISNVQFVGCESKAFHVDRGYFIVVEDCVSVPSTAGNYKAGGFEAVSTDSGNYCFYPTFRDCRVHTVEYEGGSAVGVNGPCVLFNRVIGGFIENFVGERLNLPTANVIGIQFTGDCQGCKIMGGITFGATYGVVMNSDSVSAAGPGYCVIENHDVDNFYNYGISINGTSAKPAADMTITDCIITAPQNNAQCISAGFIFRLVITNNIIEQYGAQGGHGIQISNTNMSLITNNILANLLYGIEMVPSCVNTQVVSNILQNNVTNINGDMSAGGSGTNLIKNNIGAFPWTLSYTTPNVPASGVYVPNTTGMDMMVYCYGGNGCTIGVNNKNTGILFSPSGGEPKGGSCFLPANGTIGINYQTAPTWSWIPV